MSASSARSILPPRKYGGKTGEDFSKAALKRFEDARVLLEKRHWMGALYLGGYSVEMMLKWALNDAVGEAKVPRVYGGSIWHDLRWMMEHAPFHNALLRDSGISVCWSTVCDWDSNWRYEHELPLSFRKKPRESVREWLKCVEKLIEWLNSR